MNVWREAMAALVAGVAFVSFNASARGEPPTNDLLSGPSVSDEAAKEPPRRRGERQAQVNPGQTPLRDWMAALREVDLTDEQRQTMRAIADEMAKERQKFMMERSEPERTMMDEMPRLREQGREPNEAQREMLQRLEAARPRVEEFQRKMWAELTPEQQLQFKTKLAELRERRASMEAERTKSRRAGAARGDTPTDEMNQMQPSPSPKPPQRPQIQSDQPQRQAPANVDPERARRRAAANQGDDVLQRRLKFLRSRQSAKAKSADRHVEGQPSPQERTFKFEEDQKDPQPNSKPDDRRNPR